MALGQCRGQRGRGWVRWGVWWVALSPFSLASLSLSPSISLGGSIPLASSLEQQILRREDLETLLRVVPPHESDAQHADLDVVERVATLVEAVLAYRSMRRNERHDYAGASLLYTENSDYYQDLVSELPDATERLDRLYRSNERVARQWDGRSKRQAYTLSKKAMLSERDLRSKDQGSWHEHLAD